MICILKWLQDKLHDFICIHDSADFLFRISEQMISDPSRGIRTTSFFSVIQVLRGRATWRTIRFQIKDQEQFQPIKCLKFQKQLQ